jgi:hypothetical protein
VPAVLTERTEGWVDHKASCIAWGKEGTAWPVREKTQTVKRRPVYKLLFCNTYNWKARPYTWKDDNIKPLKAL